MVIKTDTGTDFIKPEFLDILFFKQKNLVVYPYVDLKHLHALEIFTVGYNVIDLESTALYNLKEIIEFEANNSYSQNKSLFLIYNLDSEKVKEIMNIEGLRCILSTSDNVSIFANGSNFIFYNKKNNSFLNYKPSPTDLTFEQHLISTSKNKTILLEKIQHIKIIATKIFTEINNNPGVYDFIPYILGEYDLNYWDKILDFVRLYFDIEIPTLNFSRPKYKKKNELKAQRNTANEQFIKEYEFITTLNRYIAKEFVQLIHDYRARKVNSKHLNLEQLYHPQKVYIYLRNRHWNKGIDIEFCKQWIQMKFTDHALTDQDINDFETIFNKFGISTSILVSKLPSSSSKLDSNLSANIDIKQPKRESVPSVKNFSEYKQFILKRLEDIDKVLKKR